MAKPPQPPPRITSRDAVPYTPLHGVLLVHPFELKGPCLLWKHKRDRQGYGLISGMRAHRLVYQQEHPAVSMPKGCTVNHLCLRPSCIQPSHLYLGDRKTNNQDRVLQDNKTLTSLYGYTLTEDVIRRVNEIAIARFRWLADAQRMEGLVCRPWPASEAPTLQAPCRHPKAINLGLERVCRSCGESMWTKGFKITPLTQNVLMGVKPAYLPAKGLGMVFVLINSTEDMKEMMASTFRGHCIGAESFRVPQGQAHYITLEEQNH